MGGIAVPPSWARLSFWIRPEHLVEFNWIYAQKLVPRLAHHGLVEQKGCLHPEVEGVSSHFFPVSGPEEVAIRGNELRRDPQWVGWLRKLSEDFGVWEEAHTLRYRWETYQSPAKPPPATALGSGNRNGAWQCFGLHEGLPSADITALLRDREGSLWFGTWGGGVCRYDGARLSSIRAVDGLVCDHVSAIAEDREGCLWFGTEEGVSRYDGQTFQTFSAADGLPGDGITAIAEDREGRLWFGTQEGVARYDGSGFEILTKTDGLPAAHITAICTDGEGVVWCGTWGGGIYHYDGQAFGHLSTENGLLGNQISDLVGDCCGNLWVATTEGVSRYDGERFTTLITLEGLTNSVPTALLVDESNRVWIGTNMGGVNCWNGERFLHYTTREGLPANSVAGLAQDCGGGIWLGVWGGGLCRYDGQYIQNFNTQQGLPSDGVTSMLEDRRGRLWFGTWAGVSRREGGESANLMAVPELAGARVRAMLEDRRGQVWFGAQGQGQAGGVKCHDGETWVQFTTADGLASDEVLAIAEDRRGNLWFGTSRGVCRYEGGGFSTLGVSDGLIDKKVQAILEDTEGYLWFGTSGGLSRYDGKRFANFTTAHGLPHNTVTAIHQDREGGLWFSTWGGVSFYDGKDFHNLTTAQGLSYNVATSVFQDREGCLWFGTWGSGVCRYDGRVFQVLCRQDGLAHDAVHGMLQDQQGGIWIATEGGVTHYQRQYQPPSVAITEVITSGCHGAAPEIRLSCHKPIRFEFQGGSWCTRPEGMAFVHRLVGHQAEWQAAYGRRVEYEGLGPGEYTFEVRAVDRDLNYSAVPAQVKVLVEPYSLSNELGIGVGQAGRGEELVGTSVALNQVQRQLCQVSGTDMALLILGETGTGKGLIARTVHGVSLRKDGPFVTVNCGALPDRLVESELFGHEKGAFTGAHSRKLGKVELAKGGTLFLDEIGDLPLDSQTKLLRLLEEYTFDRVGGTQSLRADVRIIAATNRDLGGMAAAGTFRQDLYYRLRVFVVHLPPLRERHKDIPLLAAYFMEKMAEHLGKRLTHFSAEAMVLLEGYSWPGNVRELQHVVERAVVVCPGPEIRVQDIALSMGSTSPAETAGLRVRLAGPVGELVTLEEAERRYITQVLEQTNWVIAGTNGATEILGLPESTLRHRIRKLGIRKG